MKVLLTRPLEDSRALAATLKAAGFDPIIWPLTRIVPTATKLQIPTNTEALLFTSANAVRAFASLTERRDLPTLCVGEATVNNALAAGFHHSLSANGDSTGLAELARESGLREFFHPRGLDTASDLKGWLARTGHNVTEAVLYQAEEVGPPSTLVSASLTGGSVDLITVWSLRGAQIMAGHLGRSGAIMENTGLLAISHRAADPLQKLGFRQILIADSPNQASMMKKIQAFSADVLK